MKKMKTKGQQRKMHITRIIRNACFVLRGIVVRIKNRGRVVLPVHSRLDRRTSIYTSDGKIEFGSGFVSSANDAFSALDGGKMVIGRRVIVNRNCLFICRSSIRIGNHCTFGPNICIYDHDHMFGEEGVRQGYKYGDVIIDDHCWIGAGVIILRNTHIGEGSVIGAGCVVKGEIPPHSLVTQDRRLSITRIKDQ